MADNKTQEPQEVSCLLIGVTSQGKQNMNVGGNERGDKARRRKKKRIKQKQEEGK
jgi:hypothetical protein